MELRGIVVAFGPAAVPAPGELERLAATLAPRTLVVLPSAAVDGDGVALGAPGASAAGPGSRVGAAPRSVTGWLVASPLSLGLADDDPRLLGVAGALADALPRDLLVVEVAAPGASAGPWADLAVGAGARGVRAAHWSAVPALVADVEASRQGSAEAVGVGPHPSPWPDDPRLDPALLAGGDRRNVVDRYRYWREEEIVADLDQRRAPVHVAVENWQHDLNIGTVVRNANAFNVAGVHIVGKRRWNRRGAMATDRYLTVCHHPDVDAFARWARSEGIELVGIDNVAGAEPIEGRPLPLRCALVLGQEGPGLSDAMVAACASVRAIAQDGSTRSLNAGVASGIALYAWALHHRSS